MLSQELTKEFRSAISQDYGIDITEEKASEMLRSLTGYFDLLAKIYHREKVEAPDLSVEK